MDLLYLALAVGFFALTAAEADALDPLSASLSERFACTTRDAPRPDPLAE